MLGTKGGAVEWSATERSSSIIATGPSLELRLARLYRLQFWTHRCTLTQMAGLVWHNMAMWWCFETSIHIACHCGHKTGVWLVLGSTDKTYIFREHRVDRHVGDQPIDKHESDETSSN